VEVLKLAVQVFIVSLDAARKVSRRVPVVTSRSHFTTPNAEVPSLPASGASSTYPPL